MEKGTKEFSYECGEKGHKAGEGLCRIQEVTGGESGGTNCDAVEIGTVWNVCAVDALEPPLRRPWSIGNHRISPGDWSGKTSVEVSKSNQLQVLTSEEESDDEEATSQFCLRAPSSEGELGRDSILKAPLKKRWAAATAAEDPVVTPPPGLSKWGPVEEKSGDEDLSLKHDCVGECCSGGFLDVSKLRRKKRREWRTLRFENDIEICPVENENVVSD